MARRKRKDEAPAFTPPEFDEVEYMRREIAGAKAAILVVLWAVVGALAAFGLVIAGVHWAIAFPVGLFAFAGLRFVMPLFGVHADKFVRRDWIGHGATYFFSWLAFWILLLNAPFSDFTAPTLHGFIVGTYDSGANPGPGAATVTCVVPTSPTVSLPNIGNNTTIIVIFRATDNVGITGVQATVNSIAATVDPSTGDPHVCTSSPGAFYPNDTYVLRIPITGSSFIVQISALDGKGHPASAQLTIAV
jgi:hypothetical protein